MNNTIVMNDTNTAILDADGNVISNPVDMTLQEATEFITAGHGNQYATFDANGQKTRESFLKNFGTDLTGHKITSAEVALKLSGLDFQVDKIKKYNYLFVDGKMKQVEDEGVYDIARLDENGKPVQILGRGVSADYPIVQNVDAFSFLDALVPEGASFLSATMYGATRGSKKANAKVMIAMKTPEFLVLDDKFSPHLLFLNSFDKTGSLVCALVNMRIMCSNAVNRALRGAQNRIALAHTKHLHNRMEMAGAVLREAQKYNALMAQESERLALMPFDENQYYDLAKYLIPINTEKMSEGIILRKESEIEKLMVAWRQPDLANFENTAYKAVQAVADYESHIEKVTRGGKIPTAYKTVVQDKMPLMNKAWDYVLERAV